jgi:hypothetical protein
MRFQTFCNIPDLNAILKITLFNPMAVSQGDETLPLHFSPLCLQYFIVQQ